MRDRACTVPMVLLSRHLCNLIHPAKTVCTYGLRVRNVLPCILDRTQSDPPAVRHMGRRGKKVNGVRQVSYTAVTGCGPTRRGTRLMSWDRTSTSPLRYGASTEDVVAVNTSYLT